ncbi:autotransporter domain-containing protein [Pectobacterium sp. PL64]|uniref:autotransporter family protein n=1 Tax=Pectobacterium sp. PL64 TaxID=2738983 RepID=UPI001F0C9D65|nr:autotransporter domain-containing protein [Pectobacterium sp. PL64]UMO88071.1 autotransporter domain-containing protein [Pectobacterium sp. PL64]
MTFSSFKVKPLAVAVSAFVGLLSTYQAVAASNDILVSTSTPGLILTTSNYPSLDSVEITSTGVLSGGYYGLNNSTTIGTLTNAGTISGPEGIFSTKTIGSIINSGLIQATSDAAIWGSGSASTVNSIYNSGTITGAVGVVFQDGAHLGTLTNTGTINADYAIANFGGEGAIDHIINTGLVSGSNAIYNSSGAFGPITNSGVMAGDIYSASGLTFNGGEGTTFGTLTGYGQAMQGNIYISNGDLVFASGNMLLNDNVTVSSGVMSNQAAALQINNTVTLNGNYVQGSDASLLIGVADDAVATGDISTDSGYGRLVVSGTANIASGSTVSLVSLNSYAFANGQRYVVVQATADGTEYNASSLNYLASGYSGAMTGSAQTDSVDNSLSDLVVTLGTSGPSRNATTGNAISSINGLFNYGGTNTSLLNVFNASAALGSSEEANRAGARLSPAAVASASAKASSAPTNAILNVIAQRANVIRVAGGSSGVATGEGDSDVVMWGQGFGGTANQGQRNDVSGYDARFGGLLIGADGAVSDSWRLGGLGSYATTNVDSTGDNEGSAVRIKSYGLFGYANYDSRPWFLNLSTGVVRHQYDTQRLIDFSGFSGNATGSFNGTQYIVSGQTGYPFKLGATDTTLTPIAGLTYSILKQQGYTEAGGNGAGLTVGDATSTSLKSDLALKLDRRIALSGGEVQPFIQLGWRHEFHDDAMQSAASFAADSTGSTDFVTTGSRPVADSGVLSVGTTIVSKRNLSLTLKYTGEAARSYESHSGNLQLRWQF